MREQLLALAPTDPERDDQEPESGRLETVELTALRALRESRTDVEVRPHSRRLRRLGDAFTQRLARTAP
ncbi:hypothetical protein [Streptomyces sp. NPDC127190]|uniref:hypothetical protein n=1 Tax=unclassified Streptomyces TaxID=2593676 RepID=UPI00362ABF04